MAIFTKQSAHNTNSSAMGACVLCGELPGESASIGASVNVTVSAYDGKHTNSVKLVKKIAEGGEGSIFSTNTSGWVAKIYKREKLNGTRQAKLNLMLSKHISCTGVCFPIAIINNSKNECVGYLMPEAKGVELGKSVFQPMLLQKKFPSWKKKDLIDLAMTILEKISYLNNQGIILGDINPANILVVSPKEVYFVDCDSYQIGKYPCPVGTANFTAPEAIGRDYSTFLRTQEMENFAIATLLFMIMLTGKPPYSIVGGQSPEHNIKSGEFPYPEMGKPEDRTPPGKWGFIWSHMSCRVRRAFYQTFKKGEGHFAPKNRYSADEWIELFEKYRHGMHYMAEFDPMANDIFPTREKMKHCKHCGKGFIYANGFHGYCPDCHSQGKTTPDYVTSIASAHSKRTSNNKPNKQQPAGKSKHANAKKSAGKATSVAKKSASKAAPVAKAAKKPNAQTVATPTASKIAGKQNAPVAMPITAAPANPKPGSKIAGFGLRLGIFSK